MTEDNGLRNTPEPESVEGGRGEVWRPLVGGVQTGVDSPAQNYDWWGTYTGLWRDRDTGELVLLSNRHVWHTFDDSQVRDDAWATQSTGGLERYGVGELIRGSEIIENDGDLDELSVDASSARLAEDVEANAEVLKDGFPEDHEVVVVEGGRQPEVGESIAKAGARTGWSEGEVLDVGNPLKLEANGIVVNRTLQTTVSSGGGDSGSPYIAEDGYLVGQLFAGTSDGQYSWGNTYQGIVDEFNVEPVVFTETGSAGGGVDSADMDVETREPLLTEERAVNALAVLGFLSVPATYVEGLIRR